LQVANGVKIPNDHSNDLLLSYGQGILGRAIVTIDAEEATASSEILV